MATFAISRSTTGDGFTASVDGKDIGNKVDAAEFRSVGDLSIGLTSKFGDAVNDVSAKVQSVAPAVATTFKPQGMDV